MIFRIKVKKVEGFHDLCKDVLLTWKIKLKTKKHNLSEIWRSSVTKDSKYKRDLIDLKIDKKKRFIDF